MPRTVMSKSVVMLARSHPSSTHPIGRAELHEQKRIKLRWAIGRGTLLAVVLCAIAYAVLARGVH